MEHFNPEPGKPLSEYDLDFSFHDPEDPVCVCDLCLFERMEPDPLNRHGFVYKAAANKRLAFLEQLKHQVLQTVPAIHTLKPLKDGSIKAIVIATTKYKGVETWLTNFIEEQDEAFWGLVIPMFKQNTADEDGYDHEYASTSTVVEEVIKLPSNIPVDVDFLYPVLIVAQAFAAGMIKP